MVRVIIIVRSVDVTRRAGEGWCLSLAGRITLQLTVYEVYKNRTQRETYIELGVVKYLAFGQSVTKPDRHCQIDTQSEVAPNFL